MSISNVISNTVEALAHGCFSRLLRNSNNSGIEIGIEESPELTFKEEPNEMEIVDELPKNFTKLDEIDLKLDKIKMSVLSH